MNEGSKRDEGALRKSGGSEASDLRYRSFFEASNDGMLLVARDGAVLEANPRACELIGRTREEIIAGRRDAVFDPSDARLERAFEEQERTGRFGGELQLLRQDGAPFPAEVSMGGYQDGAGEERVGVVFRDVSERAEEALTESEQRFRRSFRDASIGMALVATGGRWLQVNRALCGIVGYSEKELLNKTFQDITHPDDLDADLDHLRRLLDGDIFTYKVEKRYLHKEGHVVWILLNVSLVRDAQGGPLYFISQIQDITGRKRAEEEIQRLNETLERRVAQRTEQLAERESLLKMLVGKLVVAQEEERRRVAYEVHDGLAQLAVAAHHHLQAFADGHHSGSATDEELSRALALIRQTVEEARHVISDLRPTTLDDSGLAAAVLQQVTSLRAEGWRIDYKESLGEDRLPTDVEMTLYRIAQEALTNVRKHAHTTQVRVTLARRDHKAYLEVRDWGRGFEQPTMPEVSGPGERVGLSSMRERVALFGGELRITSEPGIGTSVAAEVPLPAPEEVEDDDHARSETAPSRVLIVDDHALVREGMRIALANAPDLTVVGEAANGLEAVELCRSSNPDLVLMDVRMPKMDGLTATREIKSEHPTMSVLISTTYENPDYLLEAIKAGAAGYVLKGIPSQQLLGTVRRVLNGEFPLNQELAARLLRQLASETRPPTGSPEPPGEHRKPLHEPLTTRELEVVRLLPLGKTNRQIARELGINRSTVKTHVANILGKLGVSDRTQAAVRAIELGLSSEQATE